MYVPPPRVVPVAPVAGRPPEAGGHEPEPNMCVYIYMYIYIYIYI